MISRINLKPYGIDHVLTSKTDVSLISNLSSAFFSYANQTPTSVTFVTKNDTGETIKTVYKIMNLIASGTYGTTYKVIDVNKNVYAVKYIKDIHTNDDIDNALKEVIQQIIIVEETKDKPNGPYAPHIYKFAFDIVDNSIFILNELMQDTMWNYIGSQTTEVNDKVVPNMLEQIALQLQFLQTTLKFNHRDLKTNNIMYITNPDGSLNIKLIDFGFTCMTWNGLFISGGEYFSKRHTCFRKHRDISQLIYSILKFHNAVLSNELKKRLEQLIEGSIRGKTKKMSSFVKSWLNSYNIFNRNNLVMTAGVPMIVYDEMKRFGRGEPFQGMRPHIAAPNAKSVSVPGPTRVCPPYKIMNPATRRCVKLDGPIGRKLIAELAPPKPARTLGDDCPPNQIRNPKTRRCVKRDGAIGRKLITEYKSGEKQVVGSTGCPPNQIRNPKTRRCVKRDGAIGRKLEKVSNVN